MKLNHVGQIPSKLRLVNNIKKIKDLIERDYIVSQEGIGNTIFANIFKNNNYNLFTLILVLRSKSNNIMPSLSLKFLNGKIRYCQNLLEIFADTSVAKLNPASREKYKKYEEAKSVLQKKYNHFYEEPSSEFVIFSSQNIDKPFINLVDSYTKLSKSGSLNYLNESLKLSLLDAQSFQKYYDPSAFQTIHNFIIVLKKIYSINSRVYILNEKGHVNLENSDEYLQPFFERVYKYGAPLSLNSEEKHRILFPFTNDRREFLIKYVILLERSEPIKKFVIRNLTKSCNFYFNSYLQRQRIDHLNSLRKIIHKHPVGSALSGIYLFEELNFFAKKAFELLIKTTGVTSITLRIFNPFTEEFELVHEELDEVYKNRVRISKKILLSSKRKMVNVDVFQNCPVNQHFFTPDIDKYKNYVRDITDRKNSVAELCFPIFAHNTKIGTLNLESDYRHAFGFPKHFDFKRKNYFRLNETFEHCTPFNYILTIKNLFEEYIRYILLLNDNHWITQRIHLFQNLHELKSLEDAKNLSTEQKNKVFNAIHTTSIEYENESLFNLETLINEVLEFELTSKKEYNPDQYRALKEKISINNKSEMTSFQINYEKRGFIEIILKNIFNNFIRYSDPFSDEEICIISLSNDTLIIEDSFYFKTFSIKHRNDYLLRPYKSLRKNKNRYHYGLFLIGLLSRRLGGFSYLNFFDTGPNDHIYCKLIVKIPIYENIS